MSTYGVNYITRPQVSRSRDLLSAWLLASHPLGCCQLLAFLMTERCSAPGLLSSTCCRLSLHKLRLPRVCSLTFGRLTTLACQGTRANPSFCASGCISSWRESSSRCEYRVDGLAGHLSTFAFPTVYYYCRTPMARIWQTALYLKSSATNSKEQCKLFTMSRLQRVLQSNLDCSRFVQVQNHDHQFDLESAETVSMLTAGRERSGSSHGEVAMGIAGRHCSVFSGLYVQSVARVRIGTRYNLLLGRSVCPIRRRSFVTSSSGHETEEAAQVHNMWMYSFLAKICSVRHQHGTQPSCTPEHVAISCATSGTFVVRAACTIAIQLTLYANRPVVFRLRPPPVPVCCFVVNAVGRARIKTRNRIAICSRVTRPTRASTLVPRIKSSTYTRCDMRCSFLLLPYHL